MLRDESQQRKDAQSIQQLQQQLEQVQAQVQQHAQTNQHLQNQMHHYTTTLEKELVDVKQVILHYKKDALQARQGKQSLTCHNYVERDEYKNMMQSMKAQQSLMEQYLQTVTQQSNTKQQSDMPQQQSSLQIQALEAKVRMLTRERDALQSVAKLNLATPRPDNTKAAAATTVHDKIDALSKFAHHLYHDDAEL